MGKPSRQLGYLGVQAVDDGGRRADGLQLAGLGRRARGAGDFVADRDQTGDQVLTDRSGRPRDEDSHECFLPLLCFSPPLYDAIALPGVTLPI